MSHKLVLIRHGESMWNLENRFTGWTDVDLSPRGIEESRAAGQLLRSSGLTFDRVFTSVLRRANQTLYHVLEELDQLWLPVEHSWRLNERHYGALQGLNKAQTAQQYGDEQVKIWRRSYATPPPALEEGDSRLNRDDPRYRDVPADQFPLSECLKDTVRRFMVYWDETIAPTILRGDRVLIVAHGNSLRALIKCLDQISDEQIVELNVPTGQPLVYDLDASLRPLSHRYLGDEESIRNAMQAVAAQGKSGN